LVGGRRRKEVRRRGIGERGIIMVKQGIWKFVDWREWVVGE